jgi:cellulose synthase/poly-beta-1,6-N-acetylglucosamine synthase-like glycosyltransferase
MMGYNVAYCPEATVFLKGPLTVRDIIKQRRRIYVGHRQIKFLLGKKIPTMKMVSWKQIVTASPMRGLKGNFFTLLFLILQATALLLSVWDFYTGNLPYKWNIAETTKSLRYGI